ncbi:MAG: insulinase family protein [Verrucomicrobia bacterium]|nr:insulinase family protein [Verrucomicrobiota bacterium]
MKLVASSLLTLALACTAFGEIDRSKRPEPGPAPEAGFPAYVEKTLPNGLKVFVVESKRAPLVTLRLMFKSGAVNDGEKTGLSGLMTTLLDRGTKKRTAEQFAKEVDFLGARFGAAADEDATSVNIGGLVKHLPKLIDLFTDAIFEPAFPEAELAKEKKKAISGLAAEKQRPAALAPKLRDRLIYGAHPYGAFATEATISGITRDDVAKRHADYFLPNRATLAVVGDIRAVEILPLIEKAFGHWKPGTPPPLSTPAIPAAEKTTIHLIDRPGSVQTTLMVAAPGLPRNNPDIPELSVVMSTLGGGFSGRLFQNLREKNGFTYGAGARLATLQGGGVFTASSDVRNEVTEPAAREILNEVRRIRDAAIGDAELKMQRDYLAGNYLLSLESPTTTAARVQEMEFYGLPGDYYKSFAKRVTSVSPARAQELAKKYLRDEGLTIVAVGEAKQVKPMLEKIAPVTVYDTDLKPVEPAKPEAAK